ncbi:hypothetical protein Tco_0729721 [Tanacetum coccineum]|uniref:Uncharacterized protein n=1 Tax=Tanacetum coccineum TaxID=301880 RepID=A0ABQ4YS53_9ASTR
MLECVLGYLSHWQGGSKEHRSLVSFLRILRKQKKHGETRSKRKKVSSVKNVGGDRWGVVKKQILEPWKYNDEELQERFQLNGMQKKEGKRNCMTKIQASIIRLLSKTFIPMDSGNEVEGMFRKRSKEGLLKGKGESYNVLKNSIKIAKKQYLETAECKDVDCSGGSKKKMGILRWRFHASSGMLECVMIGCRSCMEVFEDEYETALP